ncbi:BTAD domain-containing putative transcriptional regulator [Streptoalloteichus hindustanus]|uniref:Predicted ATPase n=1 Tax=Streptoalloteichus hindustanus TaxID=2017 RepID=A0A1M4XRW0_STRHI|nr:BTAD domain-containing putative transcriptional regulator [Streptoalloteichus hindustanus]SHE96188.1 Predicted ATPase [Streptoalloteichus hindustanus]
MRFGVLGPLEVWTADGRPVRVPELKVRALLADLLAHRGRPVSTDRLVEDLWGATPPSNPAGAVQAKVSQLRRALAEAEPGGRDLVLSRPPGYLLRVDADAVDAERFTALVAEARSTDDPATRAALLTDALALWRGPAFADFADSEFARPVIHRLGELRLVAVEEQAEARLALGEHGTLVGELADLVARHPLRERLRAAHLRALYRSGRQSEALDSYRELRDRLAEELGVDPNPELTALHQAILRQDPALAAAPPPVSPAARPRTNLPAPITHLVGRAEALDDVRSLLDRHRLVTLTGPGGVGKTRLALAAAAELLPRYPDGVWLVELAGRGWQTEMTTSCTLTEVAETVAAALEIRDDAAADSTPGTRPADLAHRLTETLRAKRMLLVLDNCEHVVDAVAEFVDVLLGGAPDVRVLATSQEPVGLAGETLWTVPPLELPTPTADSDPVTLEQFSAIQLFVARASAASPGFRLTADNAATVAAICRCLDGIPLALELAATRVRALGVPELLDRLDDRFRLLASGHRGAPARQQTLRAMIDWSWELLTEAERVVLRRLAVHAEGCALEAAETVCAGDGVKAHEVLDLLTRLVDRSLVVVVDGSDGGLRYRLLESVAAYCLERLREAGEIEQVRQRHRHYYTELALRADVELRGRDQQRWLERLDAETPNLRVALDSAVRHRDVDLALRLVNSLSWYWFLRGRLGEGHRSLTMALAIIENHSSRGHAAHVAAMTWHMSMAILMGEGADLAERAGEVLALYDGDDDLGQRCRAEWFLNLVLIGVGDLAAREERVRQMLDGFHALGDEWGAAAALGTRAEQALSRGDLDLARRSGERSLAAFRELGDRWGQLKALSTLGKLAEIDGDYEWTVQLRQDGLRMAEELGLSIEVSYLLSELGRTALLRGEHERATELHERALRMAAEQSHRRGEQFAEVGLGLVARRAGRLDAAEAHLRRWLDWCRQVDGDLGLALILAELGFVAEERGDADAALALHNESLEAARTTGDPRSVALALEGLAGARSLAGRHGHAAALLGAATAARESVAAPLPPAERGDVDRITARVRAALGEAAFAVEFERGATGAPEELVRVTAV